MACIACDPSHFLKRSLLEQRKIGLKVRFREDESSNFVEPGVTLDYHSDYYDRYVIV